jgi:hypothetical protein
MSPVVAAVFSSISHSSIATASIASREVWTLHLIIVSFFGVPIRKSIQIFGFPSSSTEMSL